MNPPRGPTKTDLDSMLNALYHRHRQPESINIPQPYKLAYNANLLVTSDATCNNNGDGAFRYRTQSE